MAKKRRRSSPKRRGFVRRRRKTVTFGADASAAVSETIQTAIALAEGQMAWALEYAYVQAQNPVNNPAIAVANAEFHAQLVLGEVTDFVNEDDQQCICSTGRSHTLASSGCGDMDFPFVFPIMSSIPIVSKEITLVMEAVNNATYNSVPFTFTLGYSLFPVTEGDMLQHLAAFSEIN